MIKISVRGLDEVRRKLATLAKDSKYQSEKYVGEYLVGNASHGLRHYDPYNYLGNKDAGEFEVVYGGFFSDKQRKYVMAAIRDGRITPGVPHRGEEVKGWELNSAGAFWKIENNEEGAKWAQGDTTQTKRHEKAGWRKAMENIKDNLQGAFRHANAELKKWLKTKI